MRLDWDVAACLAFTFGGGLLASRAATYLSESRFPLAAAFIVCAVSAAWTYAVVFGTKAILLSLCLAWALIVLLVVDYRAFRLPNIVTLPLACLGLIATAVLPAASVLNHVAAAAGAYLAMWGISVAYRQLRGREGLGMGDAKLAAVAGAWLGLEALPSVLLIASLAGIIWVVVAALFRGKAAFAERIPFGVPMCLTIWIVWLYGPLAIAAGN